MFFADCQEGGEEEDEEEPSFAVATTIGFMSLGYSFPSTEAMSI